MTATRTVIFLALLVILPVTGLALDARAFLRATAACETLPKGVHRGRAGELTKYQILPSTWRRFSAVPMAEASPAEIERVARCVLAEIRTQLQLQGLEETAHNYALRWNAGARAKSFTPATWIYATRVANLYAL